VIESIVNFQTKAGWVRESGFDGSKVYCDSWNWWIRPGWTRKLTIA